MKNDSPVGPVAATIIIVAVLLAAGVYFLVQQANRYHQLKLQNQQTQLPATS